MKKRTQAERQAYLDGFKAALEWAEAKDVAYAWIVYQNIRRVQYDPHRHYDWRPVRAGHCGPDPRQ